ncbi:MAG: hypothetical protein K0Q49_1058 [Haloplasmataceae bacterium]|nr:hypothetical protein [Haloplasmataceae bacterium]
MKTLKKLFIVVCLVGLFMGGLKAYASKTLDPLEGEEYPDPLTIFFLK